MKRKKCATGGDIGTGLQKAAPGLMSVPGYGPLLALGAYALGDSFTSKERPLYGSPGTTRYNYGGPVLPTMPQDTVPTYMPTVTPMSRVNSTATPVFNNNYQTVPYVNPSEPKFRTTSDMVDYDNRYRANPEKYFQANQAALDAERLKMDPNPMQMSRKSMSKPRFREKATGGDIQLSSDSFQVKGNPNVTDGNTYPQLNAKLDHNEVVSTTQDGNKFVFSDVLKLGKKSFAQIAKPIEQAKGKAEKLLSANPGDRLSKNTVALSNKLLDDVAIQQEQLAAAKGLRNSNGSTKRPGQYATGGVVGPGDPINPKANQPFMYVGVGRALVDGKWSIDGAQEEIYYDPWNRTFVSRDNDGKYITKSMTTVDPGLNVPSDSDIQAHIKYHAGSVKNSTTSSSKTFKPAAKVDNKSTYMKLEGHNVYYDPYNDQMLMRDHDSGKYSPIDYQLWTKPLQEEIDAHIAKYPAPIKGPDKGPVNTLALYNEMNMKGAYNPINSITPTTPSTSTSPKATSKRTTPALSNAAFYSKYPGAKPYTPKFKNPYLGVPVSPLPTRTPGPSVPFDKITSEKGSFEERMANAPEVTAASDYVKSNPLIPSEQYKTPWTTGDYLKVIELAGKGIGAFGKAEQEQVYPDNTSITKASFDPRPQLYQSQRNLSNYMAGVDTSNINLRRGLFNQAYAQKLNTDSQIVNQYQQMNNQAQIQYEDRLSNRRRFNIGQQTYTDNINAANRAAQDMVNQNALTSVGQFGEDLNRKQYSTDLVNLLQLQYPDVYNNVYNQLNAKKAVNGG